MFDDALEANISRLKHSSAVSRHKEQKDVRELIPDVAAEVEARVYGVAVNEQDGALVAGKFHDIDLLLDIGPQNFRHPLAVQAPSDETEIRRQKEDTHLFHRLQRTKMTRALFALCESKVEA